MVLALVRARFLWRFPDLERIQGVIDGCRVLWDLRGPGVSLAALRVAAGLGLRQGRRGLALAALRASTAFPAARRREASWRSHGP